MSRGIKITGFTPITLSEIGNNPSAIPIVVGSGDQAENYQISTSELISESGQSSELIQITNAFLATIEQHLNDAKIEGVASIPFRVKVDNFPMQNPVVYPYTTHRGIDDTGNIWDMLIYHTGPPLIYYVSSNGQLTQTRPEGFKFILGSGGSNPDPNPFLDIKIANYPNSLSFVSGGAEKTVLVVITNNGNQDINGFSGRLGINVMLNSGMNPNAQVIFNGTTYRNDNNLFTFTQYINYIGFSTNTILKVGESKYMFIDYAAKTTAPPGNSNLTYVIFPLTGENDTTNNSSTLQYTITESQTVNDVAVSVNPESLDYISGDTDPKTIMVVIENNGNQAIGTFLGNVIDASGVIYTSPNPNPQVIHNGQSYANDNSFFAIEPNAQGVEFSPNMSILPGEAKRMFFDITIDQSASSGYDLSIIITHIEGETDFINNEASVFVQIS